MKTFILTGASRGIGEAMARRLMNPGHRLFCISRSLNESLLAEAKQKNVPMEYEEYDLAKVKGIDSLMDKIFSKMDLAEADGLYLVNNAGVIEPIAPLGKTDASSIAFSLQVNLVAPMALASAFIRLAAPFQKEKRILNISSGAGRHPYYGWSCYCAGKAGVDMFTQTVALEQEKEAHPVKIASVAPGIIDTRMQDRIRAAREEDFAQVRRFIELKEQGKLISPAAAAEKLVHFLLADDFPQGAVTDLRDRY